jgi:transposase
MLLKTVLNRVHRVKGFVYHRIWWAGDVIHVAVRPREGSRPVCSGCGQRGPGYDRQPVRRFAFVPLWAISVYLLYAMRRVNCPRCGIKVEQVPWA